MDEPTRSVLVTGASSGLGAATVEFLADRGVPFRGVVLNNDGPGIVADDHYLAFEQPHRFLCSLQCVLSLQYLPGGHRICLALVFLQPGPGLTHVLIGCGEGTLALTQVSQCLGQPPTARILHQSVQHEQHNADDQHTGRNQRPVLLQE